jgi:hypothetical protein
LQKKFSNQGLQIALMTQLWGYTYDKDGKQVENVAAGDEIEYDRKHWVDEFKLDMKIGIDVTEPEYETAAKSDSGAKPAVKKIKGYTAPKWLGAFSVTGYPTFALIDRNGIVRKIWVGGSDTIDERFATEIQKLLGEKSSGTQ